MKASNFFLVIFVLLLFVALAATPFMLGLEILSETNQSHNPNNFVAEGPLLDPGTGGGGSGGGVAGTDCACGDPIIDGGGGGTAS